LTSLVASREHPQGIFASAYMADSGGLGAPLASPVGCHVYGLLVCRNQGTAGVDVRTGQFAGCGEREH
jgi:hypothetical protein